MSYFKPRFLGPHVSSAPCDREFSMHLIPPPAAGYQERHSTGSNRLLSTGRRIQMRLEISARAIGNKSFLTTSLKVFLGRYSSMMWSRRGAGSADERQAGISPRYCFHLDLLMQSSSSIRRISYCFGVSFSPKPSAIDPIIIGARQSWRMEKELLSFPETPCERLTSREICRQRIHAAAFKLHDGDDVAAPWRKYTISLAAARMPYVRIDIIYVRKSVI